MINASPFELAEKEQLGLNITKLELFDEYCKRQESDEFIILSNRNMYYKNYSYTTTPIQLNSITKVFSGIAIGLLLDEGLISSLETTIDHYFPSLKDTNKGEITIRNILNHTSGIVTLGHDAVLGSVDDCIKYVLSLELESSPGESSRYNNEAVALISEIVEKASGQPLDTYLSKRLFEPLAITNWSWEKDKKGTPYAYYGLSLTGKDFAKVGQLFLQKGIWNEKRVLSERWIVESTQPNCDIDRNWGYLWITAFNKKDEYIGFGMSGSDGQFILVCPEKKYVAIRLVHRKKDKPTPTAENFFKYAIDLIS